MPTLRLHALLRFVAVIPVLFTPTWAQTPVINSVISASAFGGFSTIAPGTWIEIYGSNLAAGTRSWTGADFTGNNAPTSLDGTTVTIDGQSAFIAYISPTQVNAQVPSNILTGPQSVVASTPNGSSSPYSVTVAPTEPGLLAPPSFKVGGKQYVAALFSDGQTYALPPGSVPGVPSRPAKFGDTLTFYGIGFGPVAPNIPAGQIVAQNNALAIYPFTIGAYPVSFAYAGLAPGVIGLYQFNAVVPNAPTNELAPLSFTLGGTPGSQTLYIPIQNSPVPQIQSITLSSTSIPGGTSATGTITLSSPAPETSGGITVNLSSSSAAASTYTDSAYFTPGSASGAFLIISPPTTTTQTVTITATNATSSAQATLTVTPLSPASTPAYKGLSVFVRLTPPNVAGTPSGYLNLNFAPSYSSYPANITLNGDYYFSPMLGTPIQAMLYFASSSANALTYSYSNPLAGSLVYIESSQPNLSGISPVTGATLRVTLYPQAGNPTAGVAIGSLSVPTAKFTIGGTIEGAYTGAALAGP